MKVNIRMRAVAEATISVEISDDELQQLADDLEISDVMNLADEDIIDYAAEKDLVAPLLCWHCESDGLSIGEFEIIDGVGKQLGEIIER